MAEAETNLSNVMLLGTAATGSANRRVKSTQVYSAAFIEDVLDATVDRGVMAQSLVFGPASERSPNDEPDYATAFGGLAYNSDILLDTTTTPLAVTIVAEPTSDPWYGADHGKLGGFVGRRDGAGISVVQKPGFFEIADDDALLEDVPFASSTTAYVVALTLGTHPSVVTANPRTGDFEYTEDVTEIGYVFTPAAVTDLGGSIRLEFATGALFLPADSMAGRQVVVYLAAGPLTDTASAIVTATVTFSGGTNRVEIGVLGQGTVSTTLADYRVCLLGPIVTDKGFSAGVPNFLDDSKGAILIGVINGGGVPNVNFSLNFPLFTTASVFAVLSPQVSRDLSELQRRFLKLDVKQYDDEDAPDKFQIAVTTRPSNVKYSGSRSWNINEEGEQDQVTTKSDFYYIADDSGAAVGDKREFRQHLNAAQTGSQVLVVTGGTSLPTDLITEYDTIRPPNWSTAGVALATVTRFFVPMRLNNVVIEEVRVEYRRATVTDVCEIRLVSWSAISAAPFVLEGPLTLTGTGDTSQVFTAPGDFTEVPIADNSPSSGGSANLYYVEIRIANDGVAQNIQVKNVELRGRLLKNYPVNS